MLSVGGDYLEADTCISLSEGVGWVESCSRVGDERSTCRDSIVARSIFYSYFYICVTYQSYTE